MKSILVKLKALDLPKHFSGAMGQLANFDEEMEEDGVFFLAENLQPFDYLLLGDLCG